MSRRAARTLDAVPVDESSSGGRRAPVGHPAFDEVVSPEIPLLLRAARVMVLNEPEAEDAVQETLLRAYRASDSFDGRYPRAWLLTVLRNAVYSGWRRASKDTSAEVVESGRQRPVASAEDELTDATLAADLGAALRDLPDHQRGAVLLVDVEGFSTAEAAVLLGVRPGTVMSRLHRARHRMRSDLQARGKVEGMSGESREALLGLLPRRRDCRESARLLQLHLDGELDSVRTEFLTSHVDVCRRCGPDARAYTQIRAALRGRSTEPDDGAVGRLRHFVADLDDTTTN